MPVLECQGETHTGVLTANQSRHQAVCSGAKSLDFPPFRLILSLPSIMLQRCSLAPGAMPLPCHRAGHEPLACPVPSPWQGMHPMRLACGYRDAGGCWDTASPQRQQDGDQTWSQTLPFPWLGCPSGNPDGFCPHGPCLSSLVTSPQTTVWAG